MFRTKIYYHFNLYKDFGKKTENLFNYVNCRINGGNFCRLEIDVSKSNKQDLIPIQKCIQTLG